jgi:hypothetical protein
MGMTDQDLARCAEQVRLLAEENDLLKKNISLMERNAALAAQNAALLPEAIKLSYQQAADWVKMVNTVTWTLSSIYLAATLVALNASFALPWRPLVGIVVVILCFVWAGIDTIYATSVRSARAYLEGIERDWGIANPRGFFSYQRGTTKLRPLSFALNVFLLGSVAIPFYLGLVAAKPWLINWLPACIEKIILTI